MHFTKAAQTSKFVFATLDNVYMHVLHNEVAEMPIIIHWDAWTMFENVLTCNLYLENKRSRVIGFH